MIYTGILPERHYSVKRYPSSVHLNTETSGGWLVILPKLLPDLHFPRLGRSLAAGPILMYCAA